MKRIVTALILLLSMSLPAYSAETPRHVLSSVMVNGCSGNVVSIGTKWACIITASHCFVGNIGNTCQVKFIDGSTSTAKLLAIDRVHDFARLSVPSKDVLGSTPVAIGYPDKARYEAIGWPGGVPYESRCPHYFLLRPSDSPVNPVHGEQFVESFYTKNGGKRYAKSYDPQATLVRAPLRWSFDVDNGGCVPGTSGSGVFANGQMIGVLSNNNGHEVATQLHCAMPSQLIQFLKETDAKGCAAWKMGEWSEPVKKFAEAPDAPKYVSNRPINTKTAPAEEIQVASAPYETPAPIPMPNVSPSTGPKKTAPQIPPPPDAGHDEPAEPETKQASKTPAKQLYDGKGRPPEGYRKPRERSEHIIHDEATLEEMQQHQAEQDRIIDELQKRLAAQESKPEPQPFCPPEKPQIKPIPKHAGHPLLALMIPIGIVTVGLTVSAGHKRRAAARA